MQRMTGKFISNKQIITDICFMQQAPGVNLISNFHLCFTFIRYRYGESIVFL